MPKTKPCIRGCGYDAKPGKRRCRWHIWLEDTPIDEQIKRAQARLERYERLGADHVARVPKAQWPAGERWCSGCQSFIPLFYCSGSRCRACSSLSAHGARLEKVYGIDRADYEALLELQGGRCYICRREFGAVRPAVDHDHDTNEVRGLLCTHDKFGCNLPIVGNIEKAADGGLAAAKRLVEYLDNPPMRRLRLSMNHSNEEDDHDPEPRRIQLGAYSFATAPAARRPAPVPAPPEPGPPAADEDWWDSV